MKMRRHTCEWILFKRGRVERARIMKEYEPPVTRGAKTVWNHHIAETYELSWSVVTEKPEYLWSIF